MTFRHLEFLQYLAIEDHGDPDSETVVATGYMNGEQIAIQRQEL